MQLELLKCVGDVCTCSYTCSYNIYCIMCLHLCTGRVLQPLLDTRSRMWHVVLQVTNSNHASQTITKPTIDHHPNTTTLKVYNVIQPLYGYSTVTVSLKWS